MSENTTGAIGMLLLAAVVCVAVQPARSQNKPVANLPEITPHRMECGLFLPARDERRDVARLIRADEFLDCERDGFPKHLAPPWKTTEEGETKLSNACNYFAMKAAKEYPQAGKENLELAFSRCHLNLMLIIIDKMVEGSGELKR